MLASSPWLRRSPRLSSSSLHPAQPWVAHLQGLRSRALPVRGRSGYLEPSSPQIHESLLTPVTGLALRATATAGQPTAPCAWPAWDPFLQHPSPIRHTPHVSDPCVQGHTALASDETATILCEDDPGPASPSAPRHPAAAGAFAPSAPPLNCKPNEAVGPGAHSNHRPRTQPAAQQGVHSSSVRATSLAGDG